MDGVTVFGNPLMMVVPGGGKSSFRMKEKYFTFYGVRKMIG